MSHSDSFSQPGECLEIVPGQDETAQDSSAVPSNAHATQDLAAELANTKRLVASLLEEVEAKRKDLVAHQHELHSISALLTEKEDALREIFGSKAWRLVSRYWQSRRRFSESVAGLGEWAKSFFPNGRGVSQSDAHTPPTAFTSLRLRPTPSYEEFQVALDGLPAEFTRGRADVICFSLINWEFRYQRPQQVMSEFARHGHRVFYIRLDRVLPINRGPRFSLRKLGENLFEVTLAAARHQWVNKETIEGEDVDSWLASLDALRRELNVNEAIGYVQIPSWANVALTAQQRWGWRVIYDCMDEWRDFPGLGTSVPNLEPLLVENSDLVVVTAQRLYDKFASFQRPLLLARNAVDYDFYDERCKPNNLLKNFRRPIVGYYGAIARWFDVDLMAHTARACPDYTFVLLGGVFDVDVSSLELLPNVHLLGQQPYELMPEYLYHFDACIIPFKVNSITDATDPVKLYEYLSAGKPVVSVDLSELKNLRAHVYLAQDRDDFVAKLHKAVSETDPQLSSQRRLFAQDNTWGQRYAAISSALSDTIPRASIIIATHNNLAYTRLCLESLFVNTEYANYEVIVVDNNSTDGTQAYLQELAARHSNIQLVLNPENYGFARANNQGIAKSSGEYLVLLNNDTVVPRGWLSRLLLHLRDRSVGIVGPVTNFAGNEARIEASYATCGQMDEFARAHVWAHDGQLADIHVVAMFCVALRRQTYDDIGPLDEQFGMGLFEDDDYAQRLRAKGYQVVCAPDVFVHHFGQATFKKLARSTYESLFESNRRRYEAKWNVEWIPHRNGTLSIRKRSGGNSPS